MARRNRVTPLGELIADPARGLVFGNRGCLHDASGEIRRRWAGRRWIACRLQFRGRRRTPLLAPGRYTELFFLDEATAWAAGHRPCAECRHADYTRFGTLWRERHPDQHGADAIDRQLHAERIGPDARTRCRHEADLRTLPDGTMVELDGAPWLVHGGWLLAWSPAGYTARRRRPADGPARVLTPPSLVAILACGWTSELPLLHPTAAIISEVGWPLP